MPFNGIGSPLVVCLTQLSFSVRLTADVRKNDPMPFPVEVQSITNLNKKVEF
jgi:hypothetical protein